MKIAIISDSHGNLPALQATVADVERWRPDVTVVNGDTVNRGPRSRECWKLLVERCEADGWLILRGNHEDYVAEWAGDATTLDSPQFEIFRNAYWTFRQLDEFVPQILSLPDQVEITGPDGSVVRMTHGTMRGNRDGVYPHTPDEELRQQIAPAPAVFCTAHTHRPLIRRLNGTLVVNSGSAGTTFDGDPRISYARLVWRSGKWQAEIVRLAYDRQQSERDFERSGYLEGGGPLVQIFLQEWLQARPMLNRWLVQYEAAVLSGQFPIQQAVSEFLRAER